MVKPSTFFQDLLTKSQGDLANAQAELAKAQAKKIEKDAKEVKENDSDDKVDEALKVKATNEEIKEYNDSIVIARRSILNTSKLISRMSGGDKARSKKLGRLQTLMDDILELLNDKEVTSFVRDLQ